MFLNGISANHPPHVDHARNHSQTAGIVNTVTLVDAACSTAHRARPARLERGRGLLILGGYRRGPTSNSRADAADEVRPRLRQFATWV
jgi:hypothetical protein